MNTPLAAATHATRDDYKLTLRLPADLLVAFRSLAGNRHRSGRAELELALVEWQGRLLPAPASSPWVGPLAEWRVRISPDGREVMHQEAQKRHTSQTEWVIGVIAAHVQAASVTPASLATIGESAGNPADSRP